MHRNIIDDVKVNTLSIEEQSMLLAEIIVDIYFETQFKIEKNEKHSARTSLGVDVSKEES